MTAFVQGLTKENAQALLALADKQGLDPGVVTTTEEGFNVPDSIYDAFTSKSKAKAKDDDQQDAPPAEAETPKPARRKRPAQDKESAG